MFDLWPVMDKCTVVAKKELFYMWPFGLAAWLCGLIFIDRMNSENARHVINAATKRIKSEKIKLWIFPEGTRRNTGDIHPFKKGAFHVAINLQLPILPVVYSSYYFLSKEKRRLDHGKKTIFFTLKKKTLNENIIFEDWLNDFWGFLGRIVITTLPPIPTEGLNSNDVDILMEKTRSMMSEVFQRTNQEIKFSLESNKSNPLH